MDFGVAACTGTSGMQRAGGTYQHQSHSFADSNCNCYAGGNSHSNAYTNVCPDAASNPDAAVNVRYLRTGNASAGG